MVVTQELLKEYRLWPSGDKQLYGCTSTVIFMLALIVIATTPLNIAAPTDFSCGLVKFERMLFS